MYAQNCIGEEEIKVPWGEISHVELYKCCCCTEIMTDSPLTRIITAKLLVHRYPAGRAVNLCNQFRLDVVATAEEVAKLKGLLDAGAISQQEFDTMKTRRLRLLQNHCVSYDQNSYARPGVVCL